MGLPVVIINKDSDRSDESLRKEMIRMVFPRRYHLTPAYEARLVEIKQELADRAARRV